MQIGVKKWHRAEPKRVEPALVRPVTAACETAEKIDASIDLHISFPRRRGIRDRQRAKHWQLDAVAHADAG